MRRQSSPPTGRSRWLPLAVACTLAVVAGCRVGSAENGSSGAHDGYAGTVLEEPIPKPAFTLTDTEGEPFHFREETEGDLTLLYFGFTNCARVCPVQLANLAAVLDDLSWERRHRISVVFVSVDPKRDTRERIREWLNNFDPRFIGLRGSIEKVNRIIQKVGLPTARKQNTGGGGYAMGHPSQVIAFMPDDTARVIYPYGTRRTDWAHDLPKLLSGDMPNND